MNEYNEAFAVRNLAVVKEWDNQTGVKVDLKDRNPLKSSIAYVHPDFFVRHA